MKKVEMSRNYFCNNPDDGFGKRLRALVDAAGLSVDRFAKSLGVHRDTLQKWFSGKSFPRRKYHHRIAKILKIPVEELFASGDYIVAPPQPGKGSEESELLNIYRELNTLRKDLQASKDRIHELEALLQIYRTRYASDKRKEDHADLNPITLRRPVEPFSNHTHKTGENPS
ncbi:MAG: helix-turn-helix transcriptional regulator [Anaerolineales bacterium]